MHDDPEQVGELQRARMAVDAGSSERVVHTCRDRLDRLVRISHTDAQRSMVSAFRSVSRHESIGVCDLPARDYMVFITVLILLD